MVVSNLMDGVDVYRVVDRPQFERRLRVPRIRNNVPQQVCFAQDSQLIVSGSDRGEVYIWESATGTCVQVLRHGGASPFIWYDHNVLTQLYRHSMRAGCFGQESHLSNDDVD